MSSFSREILSLSVLILQQWVRTLQQQVVQQTNEIKSALKAQCDAGILPQTRDALEQQINDLQPLMDRAQTVSSAAGRLLHNLESSSFDTSKPT